MSEELNKELTKLISKAAIDGTLSESAVKQFTSVLESNKVLRVELEKSEEHRDKGEKTLRDVTERYNNTSAKLIEYQKREAELAERESAAEVLQMTVEYEKKRVTDHKDMVGLIFRNSLLRSQAMTPGHPGTIDQYGTHQGQDYATKHDLESKEE